MLYVVRLTTIFPGSQASDFSGSSRAWKINKTQTKRANIIVVQYFCGIWYFSHINRGGVNFLSFILSSFYFLTICTNYPFCLRPPLPLLQMTLPSFSIACLFRRAEQRCHHLRRQICQSCTSYASFVSRYLGGDRRLRCCLGSTASVPLGMINENWRSWTNIYP